LDFLFEYGLFFAKAVTLVAVVLVILANLASFSAKNRSNNKGELKVTHLNDNIKKVNRSLEESILTEPEKKRVKKQRKIENKELKKSKSSKNRVFLIDFKGDLKASAAASLREEVTAILGQARKDDEVVVRLESSGGMVHGYGFASSQLNRIKKKNIYLTVCVDKVAASGGYMMACVANKILCAPFSFIGSIGVVAQLPNFNRLLKKHDVDIELHTAGSHKRTLTMFGENTQEDREKFTDDLDNTHRLFKNFVSEHRPNIDINSIATGEVWLGTEAITKGLVDELLTSDEYLLDKTSHSQVYKVAYLTHKTLSEKIGFAAEMSINKLLKRWWSKVSSKDINLPS
jgi:serine protease SohB